MYKQKDEEEEPQEEEEWEILIEFPGDVIETILLYTNYEKIAIIWHAMCYKLGPLSVHMKPGCCNELDWIATDVEEKISRKRWTPVYKIPEVIRVSYMICDSIRLKTETMTFLPEHHLLPMDKWSSFDESSKYSDWTDNDWELKEPFFQNAVLWIIGEINDGDSLQVTLWNVRSNKIGIFYVEHNYIYGVPLIFDSFEHWLIASCYHQFDNVQTADDLKDIELDNIEWDKIDLSDMNVISNRYKK